MSEAQRLLILDSLVRVPGISREALGARLSELSAAGIGLLDIAGHARPDAMAYLAWDDLQQRLFTANLNRDPAPFDHLAETAVVAVCTMDSAYPTQMRDRAQHHWFTACGNISLLDQSSISFSGQRDAEPQALAITRDIALAACERGWGVVSGGARGIDWQAHMAALEQGGSTVIVLAQGIGTWRLPEELTDVIERGQLLVLSEFLPFDAWSGPNAMQRNRTIARLGKLLFVPQSGTAGGTHNTATFAIRQKLPLRVADIPYPGNQALLQAGAKPILWRDDLPDFDAMLAYVAPPSAAQASLF